MYDHVEREHKFRLVVPDGLAVVRGILVVGPYAGGNSRDYHEHVWYREFLNLHGFAFLGAEYFYMHDYTVMQNALKQLAADSKHPELVHAPYAVTGFSAGGAYARLQVLAMPILDAAVRLRYPADGDVRKGPVKLKPVALESGWVADNTTWRSGLTAITPARKFTGDVAKSSWLLNEDIAFVYRAYSTLDWPLKITSPGPMSAQSEVFDAGSAITIKVDDSKFAGWAKLELYDGAAKVGALTKGKAEFSVTARPTPRRPTRYWSSCGHRWFMVHDKATVRLDSRGP